MNVDKFKQQHVEIMNSVTELKGLVKGGIPENASGISRTIVAISSTIKLHLAAEDKMLYPALQSAENSQARTLGKKYQDEMGNLASAYIDFSRRWNTTVSIAGNPEGFRQDANAVFKALHERIQRENTELYPLAEQI